MSNVEHIEKGMPRRHRAEKRFRFFGVAAICSGLLFLGVMFTSIIIKGAGAFSQTVVRLEIAVDPDLVSGADYAGLVKAALRKDFPEVSERGDKLQLYKLVSDGAAHELRRMVVDDPKIVGKTVIVWVPASDDVDMAFKKGLTENRRLSDRQLIWIKTLSGKGRMETKFNAAFFTSGDSREPELDRKSVV